MATKLKNSKSYVLKFTKLLAFILAVVSIAASLTLGFGILNTYDNYIKSSLFKKSFFSTKQFGMEVKNYLEIFHKTLGPYENGQLEHHNIDAALRKEAGDYESVMYSYYNMTFSGPDMYDKDVYRSLPAYVLIDQYGIEAKPASMAKWFASIDWLMDNMDNKRQFVYLGFPKAFIRARTGGFDLIRGAILEQLKYALISAGIGLLAIIYLVWIYGKKKWKDTSRCYCRIDWLYNDIRILLVSLLCYIWYRISQGTYYVRYEVPTQISMEALIISLLLLMVMVGMGRHIKYRSLWAHTLIFKIYLRIKNRLMDVYNKADVNKKVTMIIISYSLLLILTLPVFLLTIMWMIGKVRNKVKDYNTIREEIIAIKEGVTTQGMEIHTDGELRSLAEDVAHIREGFAVAIDSQIKSERMKTELITNVSHDLRTPLTSIITFIDILKGASSEEKRQKHILTIEKKAHQLKKLTDDLFEAAKASSGNVQVDRKKINMLALFNQTMGEMHERIQDKGLDIIIEETEPINILGDSRLMWRVVENLFTNIMKYALNHTRVYIDMEEDERWVTINIKNISAYRLNLPADELIERFKRGDKARNTDGSGLGLSIVKSLMEVQGGGFQIDIDGDLFKAVLRLERYIETAS